LKTAILTVGVPNPHTGSGGAQVIATIAEGLAERGHDVSICSLVFPEYDDPTGASWESQVESSRASGLAVTPVVSRAWSARPPSGSRLQRAWRPEAEQLLPTLRDADAVKAVVAELDPDALLVYNWDGLAASVATEKPRVGAMSDPSHLPLLYRWRARPLSAGKVREGIAVQAVARTQPKLMVEMLRACKRAGAFGPQTVAWLRDKGLTDCEYLRTPIPDPGRPVERPPHERPRILLIGHLRGTATLDGLRRVARILPLLDRKLGPNGFEVRIVGGYDPPDELREALTRPGVTFTGFVEDVAEEFRSADLMLVPVSIPLGVRVRILTGFAYGLPVVAHVANAIGIPELADSENALLGRTDAELADAVARAVREPGLAERLGREGRRTYEHSFTPAAAVGRLGELLEAVARVPLATG
jgi:glycosyltransferase involved in cell wall biosynthesis